MQAMTKEYCNNNMAIYTGTNEDAVLSLTDDRGGVTRTYRVAKLADGNCWMLDNLKLGSTAGSITLTPTDSNVASNFTLPQVKADNTYDYSTNPGNSYDTPQVHGPVPGDTGVGETNYGYLYNWSAATAGETRVTMPGTGYAETARYSICTLNWRLPKSADFGDVLNYGKPNDFDMLNAKMGGFTDNRDVTYQSNRSKYFTNWIYSGAFKGVFAGQWSSSFYGNNRGSLWSGSTERQGNAFGIRFSSNDVSHAEFGRDRGYSIRCLVN